MSQDRESNQPANEARQGGAADANPEATASPDPGSAAPSATKAGRPNAIHGMIREQLRSNWLALLSLFIALFGLGYNTWRNETTEGHRNVREAGFIVLDALGELQQLADTRFFGGEKNEANRIAIWGRVTLVRDISGLISVDAQTRAEQLFEIWSGNAPAFDAGDRAAEAAFATATREARSQVLADLRRLE